jgi:hypothetical protein
MLRLHPVGFSELGTIRQCLYFEIAERFADLRRMTSELGESCRGGQVISLCFAKREKVILGLFIGAERMLLNKTAAFR